MDGCVVGVVVTVLGLGDATNLELVTAWVVKEEEEEELVILKVCGITTGLEHSFMCSLRQPVLCKNFPQLMHLEGFDLVSNNELHD